MSFFGFDTTLPRDRPGASGQRGIFEHQDVFAGLNQTRKLQAFQDNHEEELEFDDTYDGLGDQLEEANDDFNDDTFGGGAEGVGTKTGPGKDFDFYAQTNQVSNVINQEGVRYGLQQQPVPQPRTSTKPTRTGYEAYNDPEYIPEISSKSGFFARTQNAAPTQSGQMRTSDGRISTARSSAPAGRGKMMTVEEIEASMRQQPAPPPQQSFLPQAPPPQRHPMPIPMQQQMPNVPQGPPPMPLQPPVHPQHAPPPSFPQQSTDRAPPQPLRSQQVQPQAPLQILQNPNRSQHMRQPSQPLQVGNLPIITHPDQLMQLSEEQRRAYTVEAEKAAKRNHKIFQLSKGNGLMTPQDKNFITRIQLQQLVSATGNVVEGDTESALVEDFYYQVYSQIRGAPRQTPNEPLGHFAQTYLFQTGGRYHGRRNNVNGDSHIQRMQQQVQRAVEAAKAKPKSKQLIIEGSLGKISFSNAKTPKPLLNLKRNDSEAQIKKVMPVANNDRKSVLRNIEAVYTALMALEDQERTMPPPPSPDSPPEQVEHLALWRDEQKRLISTLWSALHIMDPIVPGSAQTHPFIAFLSFTKGKKALPRIFRQIDQEQQVTILTMIVVHLDQLDVIRNARPVPGEGQPPAQIREEIEVFSHNVMTSLMSYVQDAPINIMIGLLQLLIDHTNVVQIAQSRIGLGIITMLLSRAEIVKDSGDVSNADWQDWVGHYNRLFDILEPMLPLAFPGPVNAGGDVYVWQFLAALGIGASPEQQQRLVISVKDRVMDTVMQSRSLPAEMGRQRLDNVNLFMRGIGLDVSMLG